MAIPKNRQEFQDKCLRKLGYPVIEINVDDDQVGDCIDDALEKYWESHYDGVEKLYMKHQVDAGDMANNSIPIVDTIRGVTKIFPIFSSLTSTINMFDVRYQYMLQSLPNFTSLSLVDYEITMMHLESINMAFNGIPGIRFNQATHVLHLDIDWTNDIRAGDWIIIECTRILDPDTFPSVWRDPWLRKYATALIKQQWGANIKKFSGVALPGGITMNGQVIYDEATTDLQELELELDSTYSEPPMFRMG